MGRVTLGPAIGTNNQLYHKWIHLDAGTTYRLQYRASASQSTTIRTRVIEQDDDYTTYGFPFQTFSLTTDWKTYTVDFTAGNFTGTVTDGMLQFYFPGSTPSTTIYFDEVAISAATSQPLPKSAGSDTDAGGEMTAVRPANFLLRQNYPNPFNPTTDIQYEVAEFSDVRLSIFDILGREITVLWFGARNPGVYSATFDASGLASGVYICRFEARPEETTSKAIVLMKRLVLVR